MAGHADLSGVCVRGGGVPVVLSFFEFSISLPGTRWPCCLSCLFGDAGVAGHVDLSGVRNCGCSIFRIFHFWVSPSAPKSRFCLGLRSG